MIKRTHNGAYSRLIHNASFYFPNRSVSRYLFITRRSVCHLDNAFSNLQDYGSFLSLTYHIRCLEITARSYARNKCAFEKVEKTTVRKSRRTRLMAKEKERERERKTWERFHRNRAGPVPCQRTEARRNQTDIRVLARVSVSRSRVHTRFSRGALSKRRRNAAIAFHLR